MTDPHRQAAFYNTCVTRAKIHERAFRRPPISRYEENQEAKLLSAENVCMGLQQDDELRCEESSKSDSDAIENDKSVFNMSDFYQSIPGKI